VYGVYECMLCMVCMSACSVYLGVVLHHALQASGLLKLSLGRVGVLRVHELLHHSLRRIKHLVYGGSNGYIMVDGIEVDKVEAVSQSKSSTVWI
jgi:hypothetical protein